MSSKSAGFSVINRAISLIDVRIGKRKISVAVRFDARSV